MASHTQAVSYHDLDGSYLGVCLRQFVKLYIYVLYTFLYMFVVFHPQKCLKASCCLD